jgi:hypothetical protein
MVAAIGLQQIDSAHYRLIAAFGKAFKLPAFEDKMEPTWIFPLARGVRLGEVQRNG